MHLPGVLAPLADNPFPQSRHPARTTLNRSDHPAYGHIYFHEEVFWPVNLFFYPEMK